MNPAFPLFMIIVKVLFGLVTSPLFWHLTFLFAWILWSIKNLKCGIIYISRKEMIFNVVVLFVWIVVLIYYYYWLRNPIEVIRSWNI